MGMAQRVHRDTGSEIEVSPTIGGKKIGPLAALECERATRIGRHNRVVHRTLSRAGLLRRAPAPGPSIQAGGSPEKGAT
jgi:hypothetical protein